MSKHLILLIALLALILPISAQDQPDNTLSVDASTSLGPISPYVYGSNMNLYSVIPQALMEQAKALGLRYMRFGGGDTDIVDLRNNIIDLFVLQSRIIGAEPALSVRLLGGTPEGAAEIVRYANITKNYNIKYWSIGNEPNLFVALMGVETYTAQDLATQWRAIAEAMREVDPDIIFVGPDITQYVVLNYEDGQIEYLPPSLGGSALDAQGNDWLQDFLRANGDLLGYVAIHRYPYPGLGLNSGANTDSLRNINDEWDIAIPNLRRIIRDVAGRDIPIAVTEVNSNSANSIGLPASLDSFYNALWLGDTLGRLIRNQVEIVAYWDVQGSSNRGWGLLGSYDIRPTAYTYYMYRHFGTELYDATSTTPDVTIYAAKREDGTLTLMVINLGPDEVTPTLLINGFTPAGPAEVWRFDAEHKATQIDPQDITDGSTLSIPGQSMTVYVLPASNP
jgi:hypothetical protein